MCSKEEIDTYIQSTYSDPDREKELGQRNTLIDQPAPRTEFNIKEPLLREVQDVVKKARSSSALGPNGVPYKGYKHFPLLVKLL